MFRPVRPHQRYCKPSCRLAAFKRKASRPQLALSVEDELFRLHFECGAGGKQFATACRAWGGALRAAPRDGRVREQRVSRVEGEMCAARIARKDDQVVCHADPLHLLAIARWAHDFHWLTVAGDLRGGHQGYS